MELQPPQSPRTVQVSQESAKQKLDDAYYTIKKSVKDTIEQLQQERSKELSDAINSGLNKHREEITAIFNGEITSRLKPLNDDLAQARKDIQSLAQTIQKLSQPETIKRLYKQSKNDYRPTPKATLSYSRALIYGLLIAGGIITSAITIPIIISKIETFIHLHLNL